MKKRFILSAVITATIIISGISLAAKEEVEKGAKVEKKTIKTPSSTQTDAVRKKMPPRRRSPQENMKRFRERYEKEVANAKKGPKETIRELNAIKAIAEKEKAKDTIAAIDRLILKKQTQMDKKLKTIEERQAKFKQFMEQRGDGRAKPTSPPKVRPNATEVSKKVKEVTSDKK